MWLRLWCLRHTHSKSSDTAQQRFKFIAVFKSIWQCGCQFNAIEKEIGLWKSKIIVNELMMLQYKKLYFPFMISSLFKLFQHVNRIVEVKLDIISLLCHAEIRSGRKIVYSCKEKAKQKGKRRKEKERNCVNDSRFCFSFPVIISAHFCSHFHLTKNK